MQTSSSAINKVFAALLALAIILVGTPRSAVAANYGGTPTILDYGTASVGATYSIGGHETCPNGMYVMVVASTEGGGPPSTPNTGQGTWTQDLNNVASGGTGTSLTENISSWIHPCGASEPATYGFSGGTNYAGVILLILTSANVVAESVSPRSGTSVTSISQTVSSCANCLTLAFGFSPQFGGAVFTGAVGVNKIADNGAVSGGQPGAVAFAGFNTTSVTLGLTNSDYAALDVVQISGAAPSANGTVGTAQYPCPNNYFVTQMTGVGNGGSVTAAGNGASCIPYHRDNYSYDAWTGIANEAINATAAQVQKYDNIVEGPANKSGTADCPRGQSVYSGSFPCLAIYYFNLGNVFLTNSTGASTDSGIWNCTGEQWSSANITESSYQHGVGTTSAKANRVLGYTDATPTDVFWLENVLDSGFQTWVNAATHNCTDDGSGIAPDNRSGFFYDNAFDRPSNQSFIGQDLNVGFSGSATSSLASGCTGAYFGCPAPASHTAISTSYGSLEYGTTQSAYGSAFSTYLSKVTHSDGTLYRGVLNGWCQNYINDQTANPEMQELTADGSMGGVIESTVISGGSIQSALSISTTMDCVTVAGTTPHPAIILTTENNAEGTQANLQDRRVSWATTVIGETAPGSVFEWGRFHDGAATLFGAWPETLIYPLYPKQTAAPLTGGNTHGVRDLCVSGTYPNCLYRREFKDFAVGGVDMHQPLVVFLNLTGSTITDLHAFVTQSYAHNVGFCVGYNSSGATPGCSSTALAGDLGNSLNGGVGNAAWGTGLGPLAALDFTTLAQSCTSSACTVSLATNDALILWGG